MTGISWPLIVLFVLIFGSAYGTVSILRPVLAREILDGTSFGAKSGALALPFLAGSAVAPYLGSIVWSIGGYTLMLGLAVAINCVWRFSCASGGGPSGKKVSISHTSRFLPHSRCAILVARTDPPLC